MWGRDNLLPLQLGGAAVGRKSFGQHRNLQFQRFGRGMRGSCLDSQDISQHDGCYKVYTVDRNRHGVGTTVRFFPQLTAEYVLWSLKN